MNKVSVMLESFF